MEGQLHRRAIDNRDGPMHRAYLHAASHSMADDRQGSRHVLGEHGNALRCNRRRCPRFRPAALGRRDHESECRWWVESSRRQKSTNASQRRPERPRLGVVRGSVCGVALQRCTSVWSRLGTADAPHLVAKSTLRQAGRLTGAKYTALQPTHATKSVTRAGWGLR